MRKWHLRSFNIKWGWDEHRYELCIWIKSWAFLAWFFFFIYHSSVSKRNWQNTFDIFWNVLDVKYHIKKGSQMNICLQPSRQFYNEKYCLLLHRKKCSCRVNTVGKLFDISIFNSISHHIHALFPEPKLKLKQAEEKTGELMLVIFTLCGNIRADHD